MEPNHRDTRIEPVGRSSSRRQLVRRAAGLSLAATALAGAWPRLTAAQTPMATPAASATPGGSAAFSGRVAIGGRALWMETFGTGRPTVVLVGGYRLDADYWDTIALAADTMGPAVLPGVSPFTRVVAYDRPGTFLDPTEPAFRSRSDPVPMPRTARDLVAELHTLLGAAGLAPPYVFVGHSLGGLLVRLYASTWPDEVVGMVQLDPFHEDVWPRYQAVLTPAQWTAIDTLNRTTPAEMFKVYPEVEVVDNNASADQMRQAAAASPLRPMPLVVIEHGISLGAALPPGTLPADFPWDKIETETTAVYRALADSVPGGRLIVAKGSGHNVMVDRPDLTIATIRQVVDAVRHPGTWATPAASPAA
jgi:pimeloyl-ACP methyl ester carboxylesterase